MPEEYEWYAVYLWTGQFRVRQCHHMAEAIEHSIGYTWGMPYFGTMGEAEWLAAPERTEATYMLCKRWQEVLRRMYFRGSSHRAMIYTATGPIIRQGRGGS